MSSSPRPERVRCPECGEFFSRRGLAGHRRFKHGHHVRGPVPDKKPDELVVKLESQQAVLPGADAIKAQTHLLAQVVDLLRGLDARLERIEACALTSGLPTEGTASEPSEGEKSQGAELQPTREESKRLSKDLQEVLKSIAALRAERQSCEGGSRSQEIDRQLGRLRMRQAGLLFRLGKDAPGAPPESEGSFDWF